MQVFMKPLLIFQLFVTIMIGLVSVIVTLLTVDLPYIFASLPLSQILLTQEMTSVAALVCPQKTMGYDWKSAQGTELRILGPGTLDLVLEDLFLPMRL